MTTHWLDILNTALDTHHILKHPYYQAWEKGTLSWQSIQFYARQYYSHVLDFPRQIASAYALCDDPSSRAILLEHLNEEMQGQDNHPALWQAFAKGIGVTQAQIDNTQRLPSTQYLIDTFTRLGQKNIASAIGALYAYERQQSQVAHVKKRSLKQYYAKYFDAQNDATLAFFTVHETADIGHAADMRLVLSADPWAWAKRSIPPTAVIPEIAFVTAMRGL